MTTIDTIITAAAISEPIAIILVSLILLIWFILLICDFLIEIIRQNPI